jgi:hypothetical protein
VSGRTPDRRFITGRFDLRIRLFAGTGGMLVRTGDGRVHGHVPGDQADRVSSALQPGQDPRPGAVALPAPVHPYTERQCP